MLHKIKKIYNKYFNNKIEEVQQLKNEIENIRIELARELAKNAYLLKKINMLLINTNSINNPLYFMQEQHIYEEIKEQTKNEHIYEEMQIKINTLTF